jgi:hypothetical protein
MKSERLDDDHSKLIRVDKVTNQIGDHPLNSIS